MEKHCRFCKNGNYIPGFSGSYWEPPEPDQVDCAVASEELLEKYDYDPEELAKYCDKYDPIYAEECGNCKKPMNIPMHEVEYMFESGIPCCSEKCQDALYKEAYGHLEEEEFDV